MREKTKKLLFTTLMTMIFGLVLAQDFYDINTINTIEITFEESNWENILKKANPEGKIFLHTFIIYKDIFNRYHDTYYVFKIYIDWEIPKLMRSNPMCDFYDYSDKEINQIFLNRIR